MRISVGWPLNVALGSVMLLAGCAEPGPTATSTPTATPTPIPTAAPDEGPTTVIATIPVGDKPQGVGVNPTTNRIYVAIGLHGRANAVSVIDGASNAVIATVPVGVGVNTTTNRIYVANQQDDDTVSVIDGASNAVIATVPVGDKPQGVGVNSTTDRAYVTNNDDGTVSVIDGATNTVIATVPVGVRGPHDFGVNPITNRLYVANFRDGTVSVIDGATNTVIATIPVGEGPIGVGVNPTTNRVYVANFNDDTVSVIDGASNAVIATIPGADGPIHVAVNPTTDRVYVTNLDADRLAGATVSVIDGATNAVIATVPVGRPGNVHVEVNHSTNRVYVSNAGDDTVYVIADTTAVPTPTRTRTPTPSPTHTPTPTPTPSPTPTPTPTPTPIPLMSGEVRLNIILGSKAAYMVREELVGIGFPTDAVGVTQDIQGFITLGPDGAVQADRSKLTIDLRTIQSDEDRRDNYIRRNTLETALYPLAEFVLREAPGLPFPLPTQGEVSFQLIGDMTIHGVTSDLTWDVTARSAENEVVGQATTEFQFAKFDMTRPRIRLVLSVEDRIRLRIDFRLSRTDG